MRDPLRQAKSSNNHSNKCKKTDCFAAIWSQLWSSQKQTEEMSCSSKLCSLGGGIAESKQGKIE